MTSAKEITEDELASLIKNNLYINKSKSNKQKDKNSLSYLIKKNLSQSECIKFGICIEKILSDLIINKTNYENIKQKNIKGKKEKDHLFRNNNKKIIYYAELKGNINLDTEKSKSTYVKCLQNLEEIKKEYPEYQIKWCLLAYRYINYNDIPKIIQNKYISIKDNLFGINQYFSMLDMNIQFEEDKYINFINNIANNMFPTMEI